MDCLINSPSSTTPSQLSLLDLNDYCLLEIMSHFSLNDLILASTVCKRLEYNAQRLFPYRLKLWKDISGNVNTCGMTLLSNIGRFLTDIEVYPDDEQGLSIEDTIALVKVNCINLESIHLHHSIPTDLTVLPCNMKTISIRFPDTWMMTAGFLQNLKIFNSLESLTLKFENFTEIDSSFLTELPPLKHLVLKNCSVEPMDLKGCLDHSKTHMKTLTLSKCFPAFPDVLSGSIDQMVELNELKLRFYGAPAVFCPSNIFNRLTSLKLENAAASIDVDKLFNALIQHNKINTLSMSSIDSNRPLNRVTLQQLHRLTNLRRLCLCETDFVTDDFLAAITKSKTLTHLMYKQSYRPMLSLNAFLALTALNGTQLTKCGYIVYHDIGDVNQISEQKNEMLAAYRKTAAFKRVRQCSSNISNWLTFVEFLI